MQIWQTVGKLRRRHGLVMSKELQEPGLPAHGLDVGSRRVRSSV